MLLLVPTPGAMVGPEGQQHENTWWAELEKERPQSCVQKCPPRSGACWLARVRLWGAPALVQASEGWTLVLSVMPTPTPLRLGQPRGGEAASPDLQEGKHPEH